MSAQRNLHHRFGRWLIAAAIVPFVVFVAGISTGYLDRVAWVGRRTVEVRVRVVDGKAGAPIEKAKVIVFNGPIAPIEGRLPSGKFFDPGQADTAAKSGLTDDVGLAVIEYEFFASGMEGPLKHTGYIRTNDCWVQVDAEGYSQVTLPLDRQSLKPRHIDDDTPVFVTIILSNRE